MQFLIRPAVALLATASLFCGLAPEAAAGTPDQARVSIRINGSHSGSGVLIADPFSSTCSRWVLTVAHLADAASASQMSVEVGNCQRGSGTVYGVKDKISFPPSSTTPPYPNDIALIELTTPITFDADVQPMALSTPSEGNFAGETARITGWWKTTCDGGLPQSCQTVDMPVITNTELANYWSSTMINDGNIGVFDPMNAISLKQGSSGAGYCWFNGSDWEVIGLASWGISSCSPDYPFVGTRVSFYRSWIESQLGAAGPAGCGSVSMLANGLKHEPVGQAVLSENAAGKLVASNIGPSGQDGVAIMLTDPNSSVSFAEGFTTEGILFPSPQSIGATMTSRFIGVDPVTGLSGQNLGSLGMQTIAGGFLALPDFGPVGSPTYGVTVLKSGKAVHTASGLSGGAVSFYMSEAGSGRCGCGNKKAPPGPGWRWDIWRTSMEDTSYPMIINGTQVFGDAIEFFPDINPGPLNVQRIEMLAQGFSSFQVPHESITVFGLDHSSLGDAVFTGTSSNQGLGIANIGSSGQDGVSIQLGKAESAMLTFDTLDSSAPDGASLKVQALGSVNGLADQPLGELTMTKSGSSYAVNADFSAIGSPTQQVQVFNGPVMLASIQQDNNGPVTVGKMPKGLIFDECMCVTPESETEPVLYSIGNMHYLGTQLKMLPVSPTEVVDYRSAFHLTAKYHNFILSDVDAELVPSEGMLAHWPMEYVEFPVLDKLHVRDLINDNSGLLVNGAAVTYGPHGSTLQLDGIDDYVEVPDSSVLDIGPSTVGNDSGDFSLAAWVRTTTSTGNPIIIDKRQETSGPVVGYALALWNGSPLFQIADGTPANFVSTAFVADGLWHHVAVTVDRDQPDGIHFYKDGLAVGPGVNPTGHPGSLASNLPLRIGRRSDSPTAANFTGNIDEVMVSGRAWSAETVQAIYNGANSLPSVWKEKNYALAGSAGLPKIEALGSLEPGSTNAINLSKAKPLATAAIFFAIGPTTPLAWKGGTMGAVPVKQMLTFKTTAAGTFAVGVIVPPIVGASGAVVTLQYAILDTAAVQGVALSNAFEGTLP